MPIGLQLRQVTKVVSAAFDDALAHAGGSLPVWLVLISVMSTQHGSESASQRAVSRTRPAASESSTAQRII